jgi:hypothetical protein
VASVLGFDGLLPGRNPRLFDGLSLYLNTNFSVCVTVNQRFQRKVCV